MGHMGSNCGGIIHQWGGPRGGGCPVLDVFPSVPVFYQEAFLSSHRHSLF